MPKHQTKQFISDFGLQFGEKQFENMFMSFDQNNKGRLGKTEMSKFIYQLKYPPKQQEWERSGNYIY